jgi:uncharacterized protein YndB with AHSA1/START domain
MNTPTPTTRSVVVEKDMPHPPQKIWRALTQSQLIGHWLMENDFLPVVGHKFTLRTKPVAGWNGEVDCQVLAIEPNQRLSYTWVSMGFETAVTWTLTPSDGGTRVRMEHSGFQSEESASYKGASYGWQKFMGGLERVAGGLD